MALMTESIYMMRFTFKILKSDTTWKATILAKGEQRKCVVMGNNGYLIFHRDENFKMLLTCCIIEKNFSVQSFSTNS